jgi:hypothetical protein
LILLHTFKKRELIWAALGYGLVTFLYYWPMVFELDAVWSVGRDYFQNNWNFWWVERAAEQGRSFYDNDTLFAPTGTSLAYHTISFANTMPALAAMKIFGWSPQFVHNLFFLLAFPAAGLGGWALARFVTGSAWGAFFAGLLYSFNPYHGAMITQVNNIQFHWIPLFLLGLLLLYRDGKTWQWVMTAFLLAAAGYADWYQPVFCVMAGGVVLLVKMLLGKRLFDFGLWGKILLMGGCSAVLMLPGVYELIGLMSETGGGELAEPFRFVGAMQLLGIAPQGSPFYHFWPVFFGWTTCILLARTAWRTRVAGISAWWCLAGLAFLLLQGPYLVVLNHHFPQIPLPLTFFSKIPILDVLRVPHRFLILLLLAFAMLLSWGLQDWLAQRKRWLVLIFFAAYAFEMRPTPKQPIDLQPAQIYASMAQDRDDYTVLELPLDYRDAYSMYLQRSHGKKLVAGYTSHILPSAIGHLESSLMRSLHPAVVDTDILGLPQHIRLNLEILSEKQLELWREELLEALGVRVVVFHHGPDFEPPQIEVPDVDLGFKLFVSLAPYALNAYANNTSPFQQVGAARFQTELAKQSSQARELIAALFGPPNAVDGTTEVWDLRNRTF